MPSEHPVREAYRASIKHALGPSQTVEFQDGLLAVNDQGKIAACGPFEKISKQLPTEVKIHDYRGQWILPGFVDCHTHFSQLDCRNKTGYKLLDWLKHCIYPAEEKFSDPNVARKVTDRFYDELLSHGITTAAIYSTVHYEATDIAFQIAQEKGLRAIIGQALNDQNVPSALLKSSKQLLRETEKLIAKWHGKEKKLFVAVTPRFAPSCSKELIRGCGEIAAQTKVYFQTHLAETKDEVAWAQELYRFKNYPGFYADCGCMESFSLFARCIYLNDDEWRVLSEYKGCVAHCPTSNVFLKNGTMPIGEVEKYSIRYGFGSDVGAGPTFSMCEIADCALKVHPQGTIDETKAFYLVTLGGAEALGMVNQIGNFAEGKWADFAVWDNPQFKGKAKEVFVAGQLQYSRGRGVFLVP